MGTYEDYPFYSAQGQRIMLDIFEGIYKTDENDATQIYTGDQKKMVEHFMKNKVGIVYNIRKFLSSYTPISPDDSFESGIYICDPSMGGCGRRDFIYNWEFVDFGVYGNMKTWHGNVDLMRNRTLGQNGFMVMTRARCNPYVVCLDCGEQWATNNTGANVCIYCNKSNVQIGGCGKEVYAKHMVKEATVSNLQAENQSMVEDAKYVMVIQNKGTVAKLEGGRPFAYRLVYGGPAADTQINSFEEACEYIPTLEVGYQIGGFRRPYGFECDVCQHERFFPPPSSSEPFGQAMSESNIDTNWTHHSSRPQTGGIYSPIGKNGTNKCTEDGCHGTYQPMMGWDVGNPKVLGPTDDYKPEYVQHMSLQQAIRGKNAIPSRYPISAMRHAFTMDPKIICTAHMGRQGLSGCPSLWSDNYFSRCVVCGATQNWDYTGNQCGGTAANQYNCANTGNQWDVQPPGRKLDQCPSCGDNSDAANYKTFDGIGGRAFLFPRKKLVINPKNDGGKLTQSNITGMPIRNKPCWQILLDSPDSEDYRFGLSLAGIHTSSMVPTSLDQIRTQSAGGGSSLGITCKYDPIMMPNGTIQNKSATPTIPPPQGCCQLPNGTNLMTTENICLSQNGTYLGDGLDCVTAKIQGATGTGPCAGVTWSGLTFMIAEGRSQHAFKNSKNRWVDASVPCRSYRDPAAPTTPLKAPISYARFMIGPTYDPRVQAGDMEQGRRYEWCDSKTHVICDPFHTGSLSSVTTNTGGDIGITTHDITQVGSFDDPNQGRVALIKCRTCEKIFKKGLNLVERQSPTKKGTPYPSSDWTTIGGAKDLQDAFENGLYYPGMAILMFRKGKGQIKVIGWKDRNTPELEARKPRQYSVDCFISELANEQTGQGALIPGYWNWMHVGAGQQGSAKDNAAKGNVIVL